jgi:lambda family phage tail tape measure protein
MQKAADAAFASMKESWFQSLLNGSSNLSTGLKYLAETFGELAEPIENWITGGASANEIILKLQQGYDGLSARVQRFAEAGDTANAISTIVNGIVEVQKALAKPIQDENVKEALAGELGLLTQMLERYQAIQKNADMAKVVATTREVTEELNRELETLQGLESATDRVFEKSVDENTRQQELVKELIAQWEGYADALNKAGINSGSAGQAIEDLQLRLKELQAEAQASVDKLLGMSDAYRKLVENFTATAGDHIPLPAFGDTAKEQEFNEQLLALNRAMQDGRLSATEYAEAVQQLRFQFGEGGAATGVREFFAALQEGGQTSKQVFSLLQNGLDGFSQNLSEMLATGKANWSDYFASIEEMIIKSDLANLLKSALGFLNNSNFFTSGFLGNFFGGGGLFGPIGSGHASGGPVDAGTIYPVGEHGIEFFKPSVPGQILTGDQFRRQLGTPKAGGQVINMPVTINGVTDVDSFKKSMPQVRAELYRGAAQAHGRFNR